MNRTATVASSTTAMSITEQDFTTPDRSSTKVLSSSSSALAVGTGGSHAEVKKEDINSRSRVSAKLVTPPDSFSTAAASRKESAALAAAAAAAEAATKGSTVNTNCLAEDNKQVRFDKKVGNETTAPLSQQQPGVCTVASDGGESHQSSSSTSSTSPSSSSSKRGLVSRRGGRCASPGRNLLPPPVGAKPSKEAAEAAAAVLEFKTHLSPKRNRQQNNENDREGSNHVDSIPSFFSTNGSNSIGRRKEPKPTSVSHDATSTSNTRTNPPAPTRDDASKPPTCFVPTKKTLTTSAYPSSKKSNVTFSPVPTPRIAGGDRVSHVTHGSAKIQRNIFP